jgi:hypothetical protein
MLCIFSTPTSKSGIQKETYGIITRLIKESLMMGLFIKPWTKLRLPVWYGETCKNQV